MDMIAWRFTGVAAPAAARPQGRGPTPPAKSEKKAEKREERQEKNDR